MSDSPVVAPSAESGTPPRIFVFVDGSGIFGFLGAAVSEDGAHLAGHTSSSLDWLRHDMGIDGNWKHDKYAAHYPTGYQLVDLIGSPGYVEQSPEAMAAIALLNAKPQEPSHAD